MSQNDKLFSPEVVESLTPPSTFIFFHKISLFLFMFHCWLSFYLFYLFDYGFYTLLCLSWLYMCEPNGTCSITHIHMDAAAPLSLDILFPSKIWHHTSWLANLITLGHLIESVHSLFLISKGNLEQGASHDWSPAVFSLFHSTLLSPETVKKGSNSLNFLPSLLISCSVK